MKKYLVHVVWVVVAAVTLAGGFFWGRASAGGARLSLEGSFPGANGTGARTFTRTGATGAGGGIVLGQILSVADDSMTIQLSNGNSQVVFYSTSTSVIKPQPAPVSTLVPGTGIMVIGTANSDGSLTAQSIQVREGTSTQGMDGFFGGTAAGK